MSTVRYGDLFDKSWAAIRHDLPLVAGLSFVYFLATAAVAMVPTVGPWISGLFGFGYTVCLLKIRDKSAISHQDFFWSFLDFNRFLQLVVLHFLQTIMIVLGFVFLIVPGIYLAVALCLSSAFFVLRKQDAIESIRASFRIAGQHWWFLFGLGCLILLLNLAGTLCFLIGLLVTIPMSALILIFAFEALEQSSVKIEPPTEAPINIVSQT